MLKSIRELHEVGKHLKIIERDVDIEIVIHRWWLRRGRQLRIVDVSAIYERIGQIVPTVAASWTGFGTGKRLAKNPLKISLRPYGYIYWPAVNENLTIYLV
jgi:hypothetical protein